ncbi:hypothetical protein [Haloarchaeobius baliensis]|uniref:hypothetical protein n=1 Tax=Haloarchaeobius baliensis TaxID=1670458 RepID=UPI003F88204B
MGVIDSIRRVFQRTEEPTVPAFRCEFCDETFETAYSICPGCGSERVVKAD